MRQRMRGVTIVRLLSLSPFDKRNGNPQYEPLTLPQTVARLGGKGPR